jgi:hypothetical protein
MSFVRTTVRTLAAAACLTSVIVPAQSNKTPIQITANLTDLARHIYHSEIEIPVKPGPLALPRRSSIPSPGSSSPPMAKPCPGAATT